MTTKLAARRYARGGVIQNPAVGRLIGIGRDRSVVCWDVLPGSIRLIDENRPDVAMEYTCDHCGESMQTLLALCYVDGDVYRYGLMWGEQCAAGHGCGQHDCDDEYGCRVERGQSCPPPTRDAAASRHRHPANGRGVAGLQGCSIDCGDSGPPDPVEAMP